MKVLLTAIFLCLSCVASFAFQSSLPFNSEEPLALQSLQSELDTLNEFFIKYKDMPDEVKIQALMKNDLRRSFFRLEAVSRLFYDRNPKFFTEKGRQFEVLEDALGKLDLARALRETAENEQVNEPKLVDFFFGQENRAKKNLLAEMKASGFWTEPEVTIRNLRNNFEEKGNWKSGKKEREFLLSALADYAKDLHKDVKDNKFDNPDIEKGLHDLRRHLRWVLMQVTALNGMVEFKAEGKLTQDVRAWFVELQTANPEILQSKFMRIQEVRADKPLEIPQYEFAIINELVSKIGDLKDIAEMQIYFSQALDYLGVGSMEKNQTLGKLNKFLKAQQIDHQALAREVQEKLADSKLLKQYVEKLEELN
jgi:hypothetical protein